MYAVTVRLWLTENAPHAAVDDDALLVQDCGLDDAAFFALELVLAEFVPGFVLPDQFDVADVRVRDIVYYLELAANRQQSGE